MTPDAYVLVIDAPAPFIVANGGHGSWQGQRHLVAKWRAKAAWAAKAARIPPITGHVRITAFVGRNHNRGRWDPANWSGTAKACVDGLRDAGVLVDDSTAYVTGPDMRAGTVQPTARLTLVITPAQPEKEPS